MTTTLLASLVQGIEENPTDRALRLVYADALEEGGASGAAALQREIAGGIWEGADVGGHEYGRWVHLGLKEFGDFADSVEYVNQREYGDGQLEGGWWWADPVSLAVYTGTFGNYNSPGACHYMRAELFPSHDEFSEKVRSLEDVPEYAEED